MLHSTRRYVELVILIAMGTSFAFAAHQRNLVWKTEVTLGTDCVIKSPLHARPHIGLGHGLSIQGRYDKAITHYSEALRLRPYYAKAHYNLGVVLAKQRNYDKAIVHYSEAIRINPGFAKTHYQLGNVHAMQRSHDKAIAHYSEALRINPDLVEARQFLQFVLRQAGK